MGRVVKVRRTPAGRFSKTGRVWKVRGRGLSNNIARRKTDAVARKVWHLFGRGSGGCLLKDISRQIRKYKVKNRYASPFYEKCYNVKTGKLIRKKTKRRSSLAARIRWMRVAQRALRESELDDYVTDEFGIS